MKKLSYILSFCILLIMTSSFVMAASNTDKMSVLISFKDKVLPNVIEENDGKVKHQLKNEPIVIAEVPKKALENLRKNKNIEFVEENGMWNALGQTVPWGITDVSADLAQATGTTGKGIKVGVLDSGISTHEDLSIAGGWNFVNNSGNYSDDFGHGTHVAGTIGALNNSIGVVGTAPDVQLYAIKVLDRTGSGKWATIAEGIDWAITNKIKVLNMSFGGTSGSKTIEKLLNKAYSSGMLLTAATGNNGNSYPTYPAQYDSVIAVGSTDETHSIAGFSNTGSKVELVAPGVNILSTYTGNTYIQMAGTSMATPHVSGAAALIWSVNPELSNVEIRDMLDKGATDLGVPGRDSIYGYGLVNSYASLK